MLDKVRKYQETCNWALEGNFTYPRIKPVCGEISSDRTQLMHTKALTGHDLDFYTVLIGNE